MGLNQGAITIVGCGPGARDYITCRGYEAITQAEVLVGARRLLELFSDAVAELIVVDADIERVLDEIEKRRGFKRIVVLVTGDPGLFSLAQPVIRRFGRHACRVIPGISAVQVAFARLGLDWEDARIISLHGRNPALSPKTLSGASKIAILAGGEESIPSIQDLTARLGPGYTGFVCKNLTLDHEEIVQTDPADLPSLRLSTRTIILLVKKGLL